MTPQVILWCFVLLRLFQQVAEWKLAQVNRRYYQDASRQKEAQKILGITDEDLKRTLAYSADKYTLGALVGWLQVGVTLIFIALGGLGFVEEAARAVATQWDFGQLVTGLLFFAFLGLLSLLIGLPVSYYRTFVIEAKHGFNRQTKRGFWLDQLKGLVLATAFGLPIAALVLWIMGEAGARWWVFAWLALTGFSLLTAWIFPTVLAPLFNTFKPVESGELKDLVDALAAKVGFQTAGVFVMDASKRSSHGNAYFTGVFGKKRIVLFDTLVDSMSPREVVAVLAHELGHFKLHHVRLSLIRGTLFSALTFYLLSLCLPLSQFYTAFGLSGVSNYGALVVFGAWFALVEFLLQPLHNCLSRRNEFAADQFALANLGGGYDLGRALLKLREKSASMPISHPAFSSMYYSHPPLIERLNAMGSPTLP